MRMGNFPGARAELDAALERIDDEHDLVPALLNRGWLALERGEVEAAVRDLSRCRDLAAREGGGRRRRD